MSPTFKLWLNALKPKPLPVSGAERIRSALGALVGIGFTAFISLWIAKQTGLSLWLVAPIGASAVLVFAVPASPLAQPWSVVAGNTISAMAGLLCSILITDPVIAAATAVSSAIGLMFLTRSLHPPGGAMALLIVLAGVKDPTFLLFPAFTNSLLLVIAGIAYNTAFKRNYPHIAPVATPDSNALSRVAPEDVEAALRHVNTYLDISLADIENILILSEKHAYQRLMTHIRARDIMTAEPISVEFGTPLSEAWSLMQKQGIRALPVTDRQKRVLGLITHDDFLKHAEGDGLARFGKGVKKLVARTPSPYSDKPEVAGQIMRADPICADQDADVANLVPLFSDTGLHHLLILDDTRRLIGILSASDVMRAVYHHSKAA